MEVDQSEVRHVLAPHLCLGVKFALQGCGIRVKFWGMGFRVQG